MVLIGHSSLYFFDGLIAVPAYDCHRQTKGIKTSFASHKVTMFFIDFPRQGESMENELSCHIRTRADNPRTFSQSRDPGILRDLIPGYP